MGSELDIPQYQVRLRDDVEWDELVAFGRGLAAGSRWVLGDLACRVGRRYGEARLEAFAEEIDVGYSVLRDYKAVARAFPAEIVGRQTHSWSVYQALAAQEDRLELVSGEPMTAAQARELAASRRKPAKPRKPRKPSRARAQASSRASGDGAGTRQGASGGQQDARPAGGAAAGAEESRQPGKRCAARTWPCRGASGGRSSTGCPSWRGCGSNSATPPGCGGGWPGCRNMMTRRWREKWPSSGAAAPGARPA